MKPKNIENYEKLKIVNYSSESENRDRFELVGLLKDAPIPDEQLLSNLGLFLDSKSLARILFMDLLIRKTVDVPGVIMEFGTRWGQNLALFSALRGIYDPFNRHRKIIGFDTFQGFPQITSEDGRSEMMKEGTLTVTKDYSTFLERVLTAHEKLNPLNHLKKFELKIGDATQTLPEYLKTHPETIVSLAFFDFDLYKPTKECLALLKPRLVKGSIVAFDELNDPDSPGETTAVMEVLGLNNLRLKRHPHTSRTSFFVLE